MHSPETGGPEMLIELAYRLIVEETPFIQNIRNKVITRATGRITRDGLTARRMTIAESSNLVMLLGS